MNEAARESAADARSRSTDRRLDALIRIIRRFLAKKKPTLKATKQVFSNGRWVNVLTMPNYDAKKKYRRRTLWESAK